MKAAPHLIRSVGFWGLSAVVLNGMVGAGIFALPGSVAPFAGGWTPLVILCVGLALLPVVFVFAGLSALFDETGGPILYVDAAFGPAAAFQTGWIQSLSTAAASAANANLLADYVLRLLPSTPSDPWRHGGIVLAATSLALAINLFDAHGSAAWLKRISVAKLLPLALLFLIALPTIGLAPTLPPATDWSLSQAILLSVYAFVGFENSLSMAGEARDPRRDFPRALVAVFLAMVGLYALLALAYVAIAYVAGNTDKAPLATMATLLIGAIGGMVIVATAALSIFGNVTANTLSISRRLVALQQINTLPAWFGAIRPANGLPRNAVWFTFAVITALALSGGFAALAVLSVASRLVVYLACSAALPIIRRQRGLRQSPFDIAIIATALLTCLALISQSQGKAWLGLAVAIAAGFAIKAMASRTVNRRRM